MPTLPIPRGQAPAWRQWIGCQTDTNSGQHHPAMSNSVMGRGEGACSSSSTWMVFTTHIKPLPCVFLALTNQREKKCLPSLTPPEYLTEGPILPGLGERCEGQSAGVMGLTRAVLGEQAAERRAQTTRACQEAMRDGGQCARVVSRLSCALFLPCDLRQIPCLSSLSLLSCILGPLGH